LRPYAVIELGAGRAEFLDRIEAQRRVAVDVGQRFAEAFRARNIEFSCRDLEKDRLDDLGPVDVAICSDVFEHLVNPAAALDRIAELIGFMASFQPCSQRISPGACAQGHAGPQRHGAVP
jgi:hypothetical protein